MKILVVAFTKLFTTHTQSDNEDNATDDDDVNPFFKGNVIRPPSNLTDIHQHFQNLTEDYGKEVRSSPIDKSFLFAAFTLAFQVVIRKALAVLVILLIGLVIGLMINFANLKTDFHDIRIFYRGYVGRQLLISEGMLTSREKARFSNKRSQVVRVIHDA